MGGEEGKEGGRMSVSLRSSSLAEKRRKLRGWELESSTGVGEISVCLFPAWEMLEDAWKLRREKMKSAQMEMRGPSLFSVLTVLFLSTNIGSPADCPLSTAQTPHLSSKWHGPPGCARLKLWFLTGGL